MDKCIFKLEKEVPWYIYGYTTRGKKLIQKLKKDGCNVKGFIDRDAKYLKEEEDNIINSSDINISCESIIVISCQTINTSLKIAEDLSKQGYNNLIFMVAGKKFQRKYALDIRRIYEKIFVEGIIEYGKNLYKYNRGIINQEKKNRFLDNNVTIEVPIELLYTKTISQVEKERKLSSIEKVRYNIMDSADIPLLIIKDVNLFFELVFKGKGDAQEYFSTYAYLGNRDYTSCIEDRIATLEIWREELKKGLDYFFDAAASVQWNEKGYFNVIDGVHRSLFLYYSGIHFIPVTMTKVDYSFYYNKKIRQELLCDLKKYGKTDWEDYFYRYYQPKILCELFKYIKYNSINKEGFLDLYSETGYFACMADKFGFSTVASMSNREKLVVENAQLLYVNNIHLFNEKKALPNFKDYNIIIISVQNNYFMQTLEYKKQNSKVLLFVIKDCEKESFDDFDSEELYSYLEDGKIKKMVVIK